MPDVNDVALIAASTIIVSGGSVSEASQAASEAAVKAGAADTALAEISGVAVGNAMRAQGKTSEEVVKAAAQAVTDAGGNGELEATVVGTMISRNGGTAAEAGAAAAT